MKMPIALVACLAAGLIANAQQDEFSPPRTIVIGPINFSAATGPVTNGPFNLSPYLGTGKIDILYQTNVLATSLSAVFTNTIATNLVFTGTFTNSLTTNMTFSAAFTNSISGSSTNGSYSLAGGTLTLAIYSSVDQSTIVPAANFALQANATAIGYSNTATGARLFSTNNILLPGANISPQAASAGFATPYLAWAQFTNSGAITLAPGWTEVGLRLYDLKSYLYLVWTPGGAVTNFTCAAVLTAPAK